MLHAEVLDKRGPERVVGDLLVGFDPVATFLELAEQRYGCAATFCADALGGAVVGIKWRPQARMLTSTWHACRKAPCAM